MSSKVSKVKVWSNLDGTRLVPDGDKDAAHLVAMPGHLTNSDMLKGFENVDEFFSNPTGNEPQQTVKISPALGRTDTPPVANKDKSSVTLIKEPQPASTGLAQSAAPAKVAAPKVPQASPAKKGKGK